MVHRKRSPFEVVVVTVVVVLTVVLGAGIYAGRMKIQKSNLMIQELSMLRSSSLLYKIINKRNVQDLKQLATSEYEVEGTKLPYIERLPLSKDGEITDPFGNPYSYSPKTSWICSTSPGYELCSGHAKHQRL
jgi:hypothetical protein